MTSYQPVLDYIEQYWQTCTYGSTDKIRGGWRNRIMQLGRIKLPFVVVSPNHQYFAGTQFYWDSYFTVLGLVVSGRVHIAKGMVDNVCYLFEKFGYIPARNSWTSLGRTQPLYLTRMAFEVFEHGGADAAWLNKVMAIAQREYENVWIRGSRFDATTGLSLYSPRFWKRRLTVYESGWDSSSRYNKANYRYLVPVDLSCQLHQYEKDFATLARLNGDKVQAQMWEKAAKKRATLIEKYFWDEKTGYYFDYNLKTKRPEPLKTLAGFYPLWSRAASKTQAKRVLKQLAIFEQPGGLTNSEQVIWTNKQWDYPNGWPPQQYIVVQALQNYGFHDDANRLAKKYLDICAQVWRQTGQLWEKYDVVNKQIGRAAGYPTQSGFAWTNAVFLGLYEGLKQSHLTRM
jgi:alpha,alpha-trehalase